MASFAQIYARSNDTNITAQIAVAITNDAKYALQGSSDADTLAWAAYATGNANSEADKYQLMVCSDPSIADAVEVSDANVAAAVTALVPTMVKGYKQQTQVVAR